MLEYHSLCSVPTVLRVGRSGVRIPVEAKSFLFFETCRLSGAHPSSQGTGVLFRGVTQSGGEVNSSPVSSAVVKKE